ncbi:MAG TPA: DNA polymerase III subunit [Candidatus Limnocylindria bacterium]|nr:DNA polymerase III subunit [Candidatus Limnocylindria bacterium]
MSSFGMEQESPSWELLRRSISRGRLAHGYLFTGDEMETLEGVAERLAKVLSCETPPERSESGLPVEACGHCNNCRRIGAHNHPDVTWVYPENKMRQISVEQTREVIRLMGLRPMETGGKVVIFVGADRMNSAAANAFLKTLEEPPPKTTLILLSIEPTRLMETILSRCQRLSFGAGQVRFDQAVVDWVAEFGRAAADSSAGVLPRYRLLGTLLGALGKARTAIEDSLAEASPLNRYPDATPEQKERWGDELTAAIEGEYRRKRGEYLNGLQAWLRDVWLMSEGMGSDVLFLAQLRDAGRVVSKRLKPVEARNNVELWEGTQRLLHTNVQEALALEVGLLRLKL